MRNMAELDTAGPVVWPKWCYSDNLESEPALSPEKISKVPVGRAARRKKPTTSRTVVKSEPFSRKSPDPDHGAESYGSASPQSPGSSRRIGSSLSGTPPVLDRFSPAAHLMNHKLLVDGFNMSRNYSEFMRNLAAKYNNNSTSYRNGYVPPPLTPLNASAGIPSLLQVPRKEPERFASSSPPKKFDNSVSFPTGLMNALNTAPLMDMSSTQALLSLVRSAQNSQKEDCTSTKRKLDLTHPLDLSAPVIKKSLLDLAGSQLEANRNVRDILRDRNPLADISSSPKKSPSPPANSTGRCRSTCPADSCSPAATLVHGWTVEDVVEFVKSIDVCAEYAQVFQDHSIDGSTLPLLSEDHLTNRLNMKLGPALKLRSVIARRIGHCALCLHCVHCHRDSATPDNQSFARLTN